ncbi:MAG: hypothetical protein JW709_07955 [Sedimentisphaerales bacterium]|nr:hypothetical protein [Sedimentisphaerales bacterium]
MKSEERHKLKTNELADSLVSLREWVKNNASQIVGGVMIIAAIIIAVQWWFNTRVQGTQHNAVNLQQQIMNVERLQWNAVAQAQDPEAEKNAALLTTGYNVQAEVDSLKQLAKKGAKAGLGATALLAEADALRSRLLYSTEPMDAAEKEDILSQTAQIYEQVLKQAPDMAMAVGQAHVGLGLIAEDRGDIEAARQQYEIVISLKDSLLAGTAWPGRAQQRLRVLDDITGPLITFPDAPAPETAEPASGAATPLEEPAAQTTAPPVEPADKTAEPTVPPQTEPVPAQPAQPAEMNEQG